MASGGPPLKRFRVVCVTAGIDNSLPLPFHLSIPHTPDFFKGGCSACSERPKAGLSCPEEVGGGPNLMADALLTHPGFALRGVSGSSSQRHPSARAMLAGVEELCSPGVYTPIPVAASSSMESIEVGRLTP